MNVSPVARRQVHLDFHTSEHVRAVGDAFDGELFARQMKASKVQSVNVFAKCHHGFAYYPTTVGTQHPHLNRDLLGEQIAALHDADISAPIYISIMWDDLAAAEHPEWATHDVEGRPLARPPFGAHSPLLGQRGWSTLDVATRYSEYVHQMIEELCATYAVDGFWFDILWPEPNYSQAGLERARSAGVEDPTDAESMYAFARSEMVAFMDSTTRLVQRSAPDSTIFYNGSVDAASRDLAPFATHLEIESLPTSGQWGYLHYPTTSRYVRTLGLPTVGMTGRFHRSWSDFGGLKKSSQLKYEAGTILSGGSAVSIGDQLHPSGSLEPAVNKTIAATFERVARLEPWLDGAVPQAEIAVLSKRQASVRGVHRTNDFSREVQGAVQMLLECHQQFEIVDSEFTDLAAYKLIIVPDELEGDAALLDALSTAHDAGSAILLSGRGGLDPVTGTYGALIAPASVGRSIDTVPCYATVGEEGHGVEELEAGYAYALYDGANVLLPTPGASVFGGVIPALFNRQWDHFSGHAHAPAGSGEQGPWAAMRERVAIVAFPMFSSYARHDYWVYRAMARVILSRLLPEPLLSLRGPGWVEATLHAQPGTTDHPSRSIVHLTAFTPRRGSSSTPRVDDAADIGGLVLTLRIPDPPSRAYVAPEGPELLLRTEESGSVEVDVPPVNCHAVLVFE